MKKYNWKNIALALTFLIASGVALTILWKLTFEPYFTNQLTTLTWFGVLELITAVGVAIWSWSEFFHGE